jgi:hypothetical protein
VLADVLGPTGVAVAEPVGVNTDVMVVNPGPPEPVVVTTVPFSL